MTLELNVRNPEKVVEAPKSSQKEEVTPSTEAVIVVAAQVLPESLSQPLSSRSLSSPPSSHPASFALSSSIQVSSSMTSSSSAASIPPQQVEEDQSKSFQESIPSSKKEILLDLPQKTPIEPNPLSIPLPVYISMSELPPIKMIAPPTELSAQEFTELSLFQNFLKKFPGKTKATIEDLKEFEKALSKNKKWLNYPLMDNIYKNISFAHGCTILHLFGRLGGSEEFICLLTQLAPYPPLDA